MRTKFTSIILLIFVLIVPFSCKQNNSEWKGTIGIEDGIRVINNPEKSLYGEISFNLIEDLSIGSSDDENYLFYSVVDIALDRKDNIYILEYGNNRIQKFNRKGEYLLTIGRKGQGPGEFESPYKILIDEDDNIYVSDDRKIKIFNSEGKHLEDSSFEDRIINFFLESKDNFIVKVRKPTESGNISYFNKIYRAGKIEKTIAKFPYGLINPTGGYLNRVITFPYVYDLIPASLNSSSFVYGYSKEYRLTLVDDNGNILFGFTKEEPYHRISENEKNERRNRQKNLPESVTKNIQFPPHRPFFNRIMCDNQGRIYVFKMKSILSEKYPLEIDIFNKEGYFLYETQLSYKPYIIKKGYLYTSIISEETGDEVVKRYRIKNWDQIKEGIE